MGGSSALSRVCCLLVLAYTLAAVVNAQLPPTLSDPAIGAGSILILNGQWQADSNSQGISIGADVPGDIASDLYDAAVIGDPHYERNFVMNSSIWAKHVWNYTTYFTLSPADLRVLTASPANGGYDILLVFDGIKMPAMISINQVLVGTSVSQFLRSIFSLREFVAAHPGILLANTNILAVTFDPSYKSHGLFSQCSGGWDWAPYTQVKTVDGNTMFGIGIWKDVYLAWVPFAAVTDVIVHSFYTGPYPKQALSNEFSPFRLQISLNTYSYDTRNVTATAVVRGSWSQEPLFHGPVIIPAGWNGVVDFPAVTVLSSDVDLWWPTGLGKQPLYNITVQVMSGQNSIVVQRRTAFRVAYFVTGNDTDPNYVSQHQNTDGSDSFGEMWRINGQAIANRGANVIPMDDMEGLYSAESHRQMVISAKDGNMNMLRIWGGGIYQPQVFYDTADEVGVLVIHDMMNRGSWQGLPEEAAAYKYQLARLSHHPSIVMWDGCNECEGANRVVPDVVSIIAAADPSRVVWPSCPAPGWATGVNRLTGLPNGKPLTQAPKNGIETHGPYQHGGGWPMVNGNQADLAQFGTEMPSTEFPSTPVMLGQANQFTSEFGVATWSSFESVSPTLHPSHWSMHGNMPADTCTGTFVNTCKGNNPLAERNYPCDNIYFTYYGKPALLELDEVGEMPFKKQLYKCTLGSAFKLKGSLETKKSRNGFGALIWQLNEIWPTGGWGTLEYGSQVPGQVTGGRWKPSHYWLKAGLFTDVLIGCGISGSLENYWCYVRNDSPKRIAGSWKVQAVYLNGTASTIYNNASYVLAAGPEAMQWEKLRLPAAPTSYVLLTQYSEGTTVLSSNWFLLAPPYQLTGLAKVSLSFAISEPNRNGTVDIVVMKGTAATALFVHLVTLADGRFSDNAIIMHTSTWMVTFIPFTELDYHLFTSTLRVECLNNYM